MNLNGFHINLNDLKKFDSVVKQAEPHWPILCIPVANAQELKKIQEYAISRSGKKMITHKLVDSIYTFFVAFENPEETLDFTLTYLS